MHKEDFEMQNEPAWKLWVERFQRMNAARLREDKTYKRRGTYSGVKRILERAERIRQEQGEHGNAHH